MERHGWISLGEGYLQQQSIYDFSWNLSNLSAFHISISKSGAFIATARNEKVPLLLPSYSPIIHPISFYSGSGNLLKSIPWDKEHTSVLKLGWTKDSKCIVILDDATMRLYSIHGAFETFDLGPEVKDQGIFSCMIHSDGMVIATKEGRFLVVSNWDLPIPKLYSHYTAPLSALSHWTSIGPSSSASGTLEIYLCLRESLVIISEFNAETKNLHSLHSITISPSMNFWACHTYSNHLVIRLSLSEHCESMFDLGPFLEDTNSSVQIAWCADDAVLISTPSNLIFFHISGQTFIVDLFDPVFLSSTLEGCFVLSAFELSLVTPVHHTVQSVFQVGSKHAATVLMDCLEHYQNKSSQTIELIETLINGSQLFTAISACIEASLYTWDVKLQKHLIQAAQFGRVWCPSTNLRDTLVSTCQTLRVMNALRRIGIPCTSLLFNEIGIPGIIDLLLAAHQHGLAYEIATTYHFNTMNIVSHWAKLKITLCKDYDVDSLVSTLVERLQSSGTYVHHAELAKTAYASGHLDLATKLLNFETRPQEQIPLLLEMNQSELALEKAVDSLDSDLTFLVLIFLRKKLKLNDFFTVIKSCPRSIPFLIRYGRENDRDLLRDFFFLDDRYREMGDLIMEDVPFAKTIEEKISLLRDAITWFSRSKKCHLEQKAAEQYLDLLHRQALLNEKFPHCIELGASLYQTLYHLIQHGQLEEAMKLRTTFHVAETRFSWIAIRAYIHVRRLSDLEDFTQRTNKPPACGYFAIAQELINAKLFEEAKKYILKCDQSSRIPLYLQINCFLEAAQVCFQLKDSSGLIQLKSKASDPQIQQQIDHFIRQLESK